MSAVHSRSPGGCCHHVRASKPTKKSWITKSTDNNTYLEEVTILFDDGEEPDAEQKVDAEHEECR